MCRALTIIKFKNYSVTWYLKSWTRHITKFKMGVIKRLLAKYFYFTSATFGLVDFFYAEKNSVKIRKFLKIYSKVFIFISFIALPIQFKYMFNYLFGNSLQPEIICMVWSLEYISLFILAITINLTIISNRARIRKLGCEGIAIFRNSFINETPLQEMKMLKFFLFKTLIFDNFIIFFSLVMSLLSIYTSVDAQLTIFISYMLNFVSSFAFNAFMYVLLLSFFEFEKINFKIETSILNDDHLSFQKSIVEYKRLAIYIRSFIKTFSKPCLANFVYAVATTCSGVRIFISSW